MKPISPAAAEFVAEATELLETFSRELDALELDAGEPDPDRIHALFRGAHSLKGIAGMFGQARVATLAHETEELLDRVRLGKVPLVQAVLDGLAEAAELLQALCAETSRGVETERLTGLARGVGTSLQVLAGGAPQEVARDALDDVLLEPDVRAVLTEYEEHRLRENVRRGAPLWRLRVSFALDDFDTRLGALQGQLKAHAEVISTLPAPSEGESIGFELLLGVRGGAAGLGALGALAQHLGASLTELPRRPGAASSAASGGAPGEGAGAGAGAGADAGRPDSTHPAASAGGEPGREEDARRQAADLPSASRGAVASGARLRPVPPSPEPEPADGPRVLPEREASLRALTQTVRVDIGKLDTLMNAVGELLVLKQNLLKLSDEARQGSAGAPSRMWGQALAREVRSLDRKLDELQTGILDVRMVPLQQVFDKLGRLVRRVARDAHKEVELVATGGEVELDKLIVEELSDPLLHLIRNAVDHGVEPPEERALAGKPRRAKIRLAAGQKGNHVVLDVEDDGKGIDAARVKQAALDRGLLTRAQADELPIRDLLNLVFLPGLSTARGVSELSGRGVGLDVVKVNLARLSGLIDVWSEPGQGTRFTLTLPVTLAILRVLAVSVSGRTYAVPLNSVVELLSVTPAEIKRVERREVLLARGQTLPLVRLSRLFGHPEPPPARQFVVVAGLAQERVGFVVDALAGQHDAVVKPLGGRLQHVRGFAGATDLGGRRTVLVLDVAAQLQAALGGLRAHAG